MSHLSRKPIALAIGSSLYDEDDKKIAKNIMIRRDDGTWDDPLPGLVTELDFPENPEYANMDFDQLFDVFVKQYNSDEINKENAEEELKVSAEYIQGWNAVVKAFNDGELTKEDIINWAKRNGGGM